MISDIRNQGGLHKRSKTYMVLSYFEYLWAVSTNMTHSSFVTFTKGLLLWFLLLSSGVCAQEKIPASELQKYLEQGQESLKSNHPDAAAQAYRAILKIDPANVEAHANLGIVAMVQGNWTAANKELSAALHLQPSQPKVQALLGLCQIHLGNLAEAITLLSSSFPHLDDAKLRREAGLQLFEIWYQRGELERAATVVRELQHFYPGDLELLYAAYRVHSDMAFRAIDSLAFLAPDSLQLHRALAEHMVNEGHAQEAIAEYRKAVETGPGVAGIHYELGEAILANSRMEASLEQAQKEFETALSLNPSDANSECKLGNIGLWRANPQVARQHFERALALDAQIVCAKVGLAKVLIDEGRAQEALRYLQSAAQSDPYNAEVHHRLAVLYRGAGQSQKADRELSTFQNLQKVQSQLQKALQQPSSSD